MVEIAKMPKERKNFEFGVYRRISRSVVNQRMKQISLEIVLVRDPEIPL